MTRKLPVAALLYCITRAATTLESSYTDDSEVKAVMEMVAHCGFSMFGVVFVGFTSSVVKLEIVAETD